MKYRLGLSCLLLGFVELAAIFGWVYMVRNYDWTNPVPQPLTETSTFVFMGSILTIVSPFAFIIIGSIFLEAGNYKLLNRKREGLCWKCGKNLKKHGQWVPDKVICQCGHEHNIKVITLYSEIRERQRQLRELDDG